MEHLPDDVLLTILQKVAIEQPPSLLAAVCSCKAFLRRVTEENPSVWRTAFAAGSYDGWLLGRSRSSAPWWIQRWNVSADVSLTRTGAALDAEVHKLGGYRQMVAARHGYPKRSEQTQAGKRSGNPNNEVMEGVPGTAGSKYLAFLRFSSPVLLWGLWCTESEGATDARRCISGCLEANDSGLKYFRSIERLQLTSVPPAEHLRRLSDEERRAFISARRQVAYCEIFEWEAGNECWPVLGRLWEGALIICREGCGGEQKLLFEGQLNPRSLNGDRVVFDPENPLIDVRLALE